MVVSGLLLLLALPIVLALQFLLMARVNARGMDERVPTSVLARAWMGELRAAVRVFGWQQPFRSSAVRDSIHDPRLAGRGVLFVHGFACTRGLWLGWMRRLQRQQRAFVAVTLEPPWGPIDVYVGAIEDAVAALERATGLPPIVVAHSMGGLAVRAWWAEQAPQRLHRLVTLGSPHHGTWLADYGLLPNVRQMRRSSGWLAALQLRDGQQRRRRMVCFWSACDNIVFPAPTATLEGADNRMLRGVAHVRMVFEREPWDELQRCLAEESGRPQPGARDREQSVADGSTR